MEETIKEQIIKGLREWFCMDNVDGTYVYNLTRDKSAFAYGTIDLDDFVEMTEEDIKDITNAIIKKIETSRFLKLSEMLKEYINTGFTPEEIKKLHKKTQIDIGQTVWVVTQQWHIGGYVYEVIECNVTRKTVKKRSSFSVQSWNQGHFYNGTFVENSIGKTIFLNKEDAEKECEKKNNKRRR